MENPILVVMAAGLGSRYGGLKQMDPIGDEGEWLIDYSLYDACRAGFQRVVFIVREEILQDFQDTIGRRIKGKLAASYAVQTLEDLPKGFTVPPGRTKPWGTGHAIFSGRKEIGNAPFMAINADDYYGPEAYKQIFHHLKHVKDHGAGYEYAMVGYELKNTVTPYGHVSRGICTLNGDGTLTEIVERTHISMQGEGICYTEDQGESWTPLVPNNPVSLNCWGFQPSILQEMEKEIPIFLEQALKENPLRCEYFLPSAVERLIYNKEARVTVLPSKDRWYGVTYQKDKEHVAQALRQMKKDGLYPENLWK